MMLLLIAALCQEPYYSRPVRLEDDLKALRAIQAEADLDHTFWQQQIATYTAIGELPRFQPVLEILHRLAPTHPTYAEALMVARSHNGHIQEAIQLGESTLQRHPQHPTLQSNLARIYLQTGTKRQQGVNLMFHALQQGPIQTTDWDLLLNGLAQTFPDPNNLIAFLDQRIAEFPKLGALAYVKMVCLVRFGRYDEAQKILRANPELAEHPDLQEFLEQTTTID